MTYENREIKPIIQLEFKYSNLAVYENRQIK